MTKEEKIQELKERIIAILANYRSRALGDESCPYGSIVDRFLNLIQQETCLKAERELPADIPELCVVNMLPNRGYPNCLLQPDTEGRVWASVYLWE